MFRDDILITGATGAIGTPLLEAVGPCHVLEGRLSQQNLGLADRVVENLRVIVHAAAETRFNAPREILWETNVTGTENVIALSRKCPRLERLIHLSTTCVAGDTEGEIEEQPLRGRPGFQNVYEETKWEAEQRVLDLETPYAIFRVATVLGSDVDGANARRGAIHHCLDWLRRGLIPMLPGMEESRLDLIASERITSAILAAIECPIADLPPVAHISGGLNAPLVREVVAELRKIFSENDTAWARGIVTAPEIVDAPTFEAFRDAVELSGDLLFKQINTATAHFLPALLHPKTYITTAGDSLGEHRSDWPVLLRKVVELSNEKR